MREILFRGFELKEHGSTTITLDGKQYKGEWLYWGLFADLSNRKIVDVTIGEYTGLTDKNGRKIFEGDIVELIYTKNWVYSWQATVEFGNPNGDQSWGWQLKPTTKNIDVNTDILCWVEAQPTGAFCEVIGNSFEVQDNEQQGHKD